MSFRRDGRGGWDREERHMKVGLALMTVLSMGCLKAGDDKTGEEACQDLVEAYADRCEECGRSTHEDCASDFEDALDGCDRVKEIDDEDEYYDECVPSMGQVSCEEMVAGTWTIHESCENQFLVEE